MKRLTKNQILAVHNMLIIETGGSSGLIDENLLDSALNAPFQSFDVLEVSKKFPKIFTQRAFVLKETSGQNFYNTLRGGYYNALS